MILGTGSDIVDSRRISALVERHGRRFLDRVFCPAEQALAMARGQGGGPCALALRFAAKEAAAKALGTGFRDGVSWRDICVEKGDLGAPRLRLSGGAARRLAAMLEPGTRARLHLSLSDEPPLAMAFVIIEAVRAPA